MVCVRLAYHCSDKRLCMAQAAETSMDWYSGEPMLTEMFADPIVHAIMKSDGFDRRQVCAILLSAAQANTLTLPDQSDGVERRGLTGDGGDDR